jgi:hypothetical protein
LSKHPLPDVVRLVIAARIVAYEDQRPEALRELDLAVEAFAERVPWDDEPARLRPTLRLVTPPSESPAPDVQGSEAYTSQDGQLRDEQDLPSLDELERVAREAVVRAEPCTPEYAKMRAAQEAFSARATATLILSLLHRLRLAEAERDEARKRAAPIAPGGPGPRRDAAKKLLCDVCACAAESDSLDLPHVITDCIEPLETLIFERDACLFMSQEAHKYAGRDGHDILDAIGEKHAALARALSSEQRVRVLEEKAKQVVDCWGVGQLNITAMTEFVLELRAAIHPTEDKP